MAITGKCRIASQYNNCAATVEISPQGKTKTYTYPGYQSTVDPSGYSHKMSGRLTAINYYYGTPQSGNFGS